MTDQPTPTPVSAAATILGGDDPAPAAVATPAAATPATPGAVKPSDNTDRAAPTWQAPEWAKDWSPEDLGYLEKKGFADPRKLYDSYREAERTLNDGRIAIPKDDAPPEAWDKFHSKLGRPDSIEKYVPPEGADPALFKEIASEAWAQGMNQKQLDGLAAKYSKAQQAQMAQLENAWIKDTNEAQRKLESEWGNNTPAEIEFNKRAMRALGISVADGAEYMKHGAERFIRLLNLAGRAIAEDNSANIASDTTLGFGLNANRASAELQELRGNKDFMQRVAEREPNALAKYNRLVNSTAESGQVRRTIRSGFKNAG